MNYFCCNVPIGYQIALASLLDMKSGTLPVKYLGVTFISGKLRDIDCQPLVDKITSRIKTWTTKFLTFAGRLRLIDSILNSMINYWLPVFLLPMKVIKAVERLCCSYLWKGLPGSALGAKVKWQKVCQPKTKRGLGLKDIVVWNKAHAARQIWLLYI